MEDRKETAAAKAARLEQELQQLKALTASAFVEKAVIFSFVGEDNKERLSILLDNIFYNIYPNKAWKKGSKLPKYRVGNYANKILEQQKKNAAKEKK